MAGADGRYPDEVVGQRWHANGVFCPFHAMHTPTHTSRRIDPVKFAAYGLAPGLCLGAITLGLNNSPATVQAMQPTALKAEPTSSLGNSTLPVVIQQTAARIQPNP